MNAFSSQQELAFLSSAQAPATQPYARAASRPAGLFARIAAFFEREATFDELARMTDRELADIGLARSDVSRVYDPAFLAARPF